MVKIPDSLFSPLFKEYPDLWDNNRGNNLCRVTCKKLADRLTQEIGDLVTTQDVVKKIYAIRYSLKRVDRRRSGQTRMTDYIWYARKLGLAWAVRTIRGHIRDCKNMEIDSEDEEPFLRFNVEKNETDGPTTMVNLISPDLFSNDSDISGSSVLDHVLEEANADMEIYKNQIAAYTAQLEEANADMEILKPPIAAFEAQLEPKPDNVVADIEELRKVVKCLTTEGKIVQMSFDEMFTNNLAVYSRRTDTLIGCQYADGKQKETYPHKTMLVFGLRSLATAFNLILSNIDMVKQIGLDVRAVVRDRNNACGKFMGKLPSSIVHLYDYIHILKNLKDNGAKFKDKYDYSILTKLYKLEELTSKFWILRGAIVNGGVPWYLPELMQFFNNPTTGILEARIKEGWTTSNVKNPNYTENHDTEPCCKYPEIYRAPAEDNILLDITEKIKSIRNSNCRIYGSVKELRKSCIIF
uniref:Uncharacterized protein n=1 Tax=Glossina palpalis gambiensis TaxID=67801 RepID=A0A1B0C2K3_9MUSC